MNILVGIPALYGYQHTKNAIESVLNQGEVCDVLLIDNGGDRDIKKIVSDYTGHPRFSVIANENNVFVNPAWNQIMKAFLDCPDGYDLLCIMNSDLELNKGWSDVVRSMLKENDKRSLSPKVVNDLARFNRVVDPSNTSCMDVTIGLPGVFFTLTKEQCKLVYPIPETIKVWFGDNWIFDKLRNSGHSTVVVDNLLAIHGNSQTVSRVPGISEIIEQDKLEWEKIKHLTV